MIDEKQNRKLIFIKRISHNGGPLKILYSGSHLQMRQNIITVAEHFGYHFLSFLKEYLLVEPCKLWAIVLYEVFKAQTLILIGPLIMQNALFISLIGGNLVKNVIY